MIHSTGLALRELYNKDSKLPQEVISEMFSAAKVLQFKENPQSLVINKNLELSSFQIETRTLKEVYQLQCLAVVRGVFLSVGESRLDKLETAQTCP